MKAKDRKNLLVAGVIVAALVVGYVALQYSGMLKTQVAPSHTAPGHPLHCEYDRNNCHQRAWEVRENCFDSADAKYDSCIEQAEKLPPADQWPAKATCLDTFMALADKCDDSWSARYQACKDTYDACVKASPKTSPSPTSGTSQPGQPGSGPGAFY